LQRNKPTTLTMAPGPKILAAILLTLALASAPTARAAERNLSFAVSGVVTKILVSTGQKVKAGAALAELDATRIRARLKAGDAAQAAAQLAYEITKTRLGYAQEQFDAVSLSKAELVDAQLAVAEAGAKLARIESRVAAGKWRLAQMTLRAPTAGKVVKVPGYRGMVVSLKVSVAPVVVIDVAK